MYENDFQQKLLRSPFQTLRFRITYLNKPTYESRKIRLIQMKYIFFFFAKKITLNLQLIINFTAKS